MKSFLIKFILCLILISSLFSLCVIELPFVIIFSNVLIACTFLYLITKDIKHE